MTAGIWSDSQVQSSLTQQTESNKRGQNKFMRLHDTFLQLPSAGTSKELFAAWDGRVRSDPLLTPHSTPKDLVRTVTVLL